MPMETNGENTEKKQIINETIRKRPLNRQKLFRRTVTTMVMAVIFGAIACITFIYLEPIISDRISPEEEIKRVEFPDAEDEVAPDDLLTEDYLEQAAIDEQTARLAEMESEVSRRILEESIDGEVSMKAYETLYDELYRIAGEASKSLVIVTGVSKETDWFQNQVENINETSGVIVAINDQAAYIVADIKGLPDAESYRVTFNTGDAAVGELRARDDNTGIAVFMVPADQLPDSESAGIVAMPFAGSITKTIVGRPVIAVGSPLGQSGSVCYGIVTSNRKQIVYADYAYDILTTDITGSEKNASGILINTSGQLLGIINKEATDSTSGALIAGFGISGVRQLIEQLTNADPRIYLGIHCAEVTRAISEDQNIPQGLYITEADAGSPAMEAGLLNGDILVKMKNIDIMSREDFDNVLKNINEGDEVPITLMRYNGTDFISINGSIRAEAKR